MAITELGKVNDLYKRAKCGGGHDLMVTALQRVEHGGDGKMSRQAMEMDEVASEGLGNTYPFLCTRGRRAVTNRGGRGRGADIQHHQGPL